MEEDEFVSVVEEAGVATGVFNLPSYRLEASKRQMSTVQQLVD